MGRDESERHGPALLNGERTPRMTDTKILVTETQTRDIVTDETRREPRETWRDGGAQPGGRDLKPHGKRPIGARAPRRGPAKSDPDGNSSREGWKTTAPGTEGPKAGRDKARGSDGDGRRSPCHRARDVGRRDEERAQKRQRAPGGEPQARRQAQRPRAETPRAPGGRAQGGGTTSGRESKSHGGKRAEPGPGSKKGRDGGRGPRGAHLAAPASSSARVPPAPSPAPPGRAAAAAGDEPHPGAAPPARDDSRSGRGRGGGGAGPRRSPHRRLPAPAASRAAPPRTWDPGPSAASARRANQPPRAQSRPLYIGACCIRGRRPGRRPPHPRLGPRPPPPPSRARAFTLTLWAHPPPQAPTRPHRGAPAAPHQAGAGRLGA
ncbi:translation initiation factor IF-2-like [Rhinolophus ferrumequinum]|uniref:translation initiation factor IF-2-like n=1 Tax=Rhinolophus ferrumequinum TaxID=59479 RepID=UPI00140FB9AC|nr:translation initiation factor IF-2-like [Rhinolophus ferrumequinum]